jgi:hypothetical protein
MKSMLSGYTLVVGPRGYRVSELPPRSHGWVGEMRGSKRKGRRPGTWELRIDAGVDPLTEVAVG